jgi:hypothetical protein
VANINFLRVRTPYCLVNRRKVEKLHQSRSLAAALQRTIRSKCIASDQLPTVRQFQRPVRHLPLGVFESITVGRQRAPRGWLGDCFYRYLSVGLSDVKNWLRESHNVRVIPSLSSVYPPRPLLISTIRRLSPSACRLTPISASPRAGSYSTRTNVSGTHTHIHRSQLRSMWNAVTLVLMGALCS